MNHWMQPIITTIAVYMAAVACPGPNFLIVTRTAVSSSRQSALATAWGVALGSTLFALLSLSGLSIVLTRLLWVHRCVEIAGGCYLAYLGFTTWRHASDLRTPDAHSAAPIAPSPAWWLGFLTSITNPKSVAFFIGLFAVSLTPETPGWVKITLVASVAFVSVVWHSSLAIGFSHHRVQRHYLAVRPVIDRLFGGLLIMLGMKLVFGAHRRSVV